MSEGRWVLPLSWKWAKAGEIAQIIGGGTPPANDESNFDNNGFPWITPADLTGYKEAYIGRGRRSLSKKGLTFSGAQPLPTGAVLFSSRAPIGYCVIAANSISTNQGFKSLVLRGGLVPEFVRYYLLASREYAESLASGTTFKELSGSRLAEMLIPIAPLNEQQRIVARLNELLGHSKRSREELDRVSVLVERQKQNVVNNAFFPPAMSSEVRFSKLRDVITSLRTGPFGSSLHKRDYIQGGIPVINPMHINNGRIAPTLNMTISEDKAEELREFKLKAGEVVIARRGVMGRCAVVDEQQEGWLCGTGSMVISPTPDIRPTYLQLFLSSPSVVQNLEADAVGSTMINLNQSILLNLDIRLANIDEQDEIIRHIEVAFARIDRTAAETSRAAALLNRLDQETLAKAFRGELVGQEPNDEPASVLSLRTIEVVENKERFSRKGTMTKITLESIKQIIRQLPDDKFSFEELRRNAPGDYESLREIVFALLDEAEPILLQTFDREAKAIRFVRRQA